MSERSNHSSGRLSYWIPSLGETQADARAFEPIVPCNIVEAAAHAFARRAPHPAPDRLVVMIGRHGVFDSVLVTRLEAFSQ